MTESFLLNEIRVRKIEKKHRKKQGEQITKNYQQPAPKLDLPDRYKCVWLRYSKRAIFKRKLNELLG